MHRTITVALGGAALSLGAIVGFPAVAFADPCPTGEVPGGYTGTCVPQPGPIGGGDTAAGTGGGGTTTPGTTTPGTTTPGTATAGGAGTTAAGGAGTTTAGGAGTTTAGGRAPATLPFTGDEVLVLSLAGAGAVAAGTALVVAGRRRSAPAA